MPTDMRSTYKKLLERNKDLIVLGSAEGIINWDMETMMPPKAVHLRSEQLALLSSIHHKMSTAPENGKLLDAIIKHPQYDTLKETEKRNVHLIKKNYDEQTKLPTQLVSEIAKQQVITVNTWKKAKATKNYALFKPELEKLVKLNKQAAEILMKVKQTKTPYDALLDVYEPKITTEAITKIFTELQQGLKKLLTKIENVQTQPDTNTLKQTVSADKQREIAKTLAQTLDHDVTSPNAGGRIDETEHPFSTGYYDDVRITTHYHPDNWTSSVFSVLHETGHALYEQNLPQEWKYQPIGSYCSLGIHESLSRLHENIIGRSREFWISLLPKIKHLAAPTLTNLEIDKFIQSINAVKPSKTRIEADEVTYSLHVIIRFQIEKDIFADKIAINELPAVWNQKYKDYLGLDVPDDRSGILQDIHWAGGAFGYFPSYAFGSMNAAQLDAALHRDHPDLDQRLASGDFAVPIAWMREHIYKYGRLYPVTELIKLAAGEEQDPSYFIRYLTVKYGEIYQL